MSVPLDLRLVALAFTLLAASTLADVPSVVPSGLLQIGGVGRSVLGVEPAGPNWQERWQEALDHADWQAQVINGQWRLTAHSLDFAELTLAMGASVPSFDAPAALHTLADTLAAPASQGGSVLAFALDGHVYAPLTTFSYTLANGMVILSSGRSLYCHSQGGSAGHPTAALTAVLDGRIVSLDGRPGVNPLEYDLATGIVHIRSSHADMWCGEPVTARVSLHAPIHAAPNTPAGWILRATNHSGSTINGLTFTASWDGPGTVGLSAPSGCTRTGSSVTCNRSTLQAGQSWERQVQVTAAVGVVTASCEASMSSPGELSDQNCHAESTVSHPVVLDATGPTASHAEIEIPYTWALLVHNHGWGRADDVRLVLEIPTDSGLSFSRRRVGLHECSVTPGSPYTLVSCPLAAPVRAGRHSYVLLEMLGEEAGQHVVRCHLTWAGGQEMAPTACPVSVSVMLGDLIFHSRFGDD